jgi:hypothetical protein
MSHANNLIESIVELYCCTLEFPLEIVQIVCAYIIKMQTKKQIESDYNTSDYDKVGVVRFCCFALAYTRKNLPPLRCQYTNKRHGRGSTCTNCSQWICHDHRYRHKFCTFCGKQMYSDLEKEINNQLNAKKINNPLCTKEIIDLLFLEEEERHLSPEEERKRLFFRDELESINKSNESNMFCCYIYNMTWESQSKKFRCGSDAIKYCNDCRMCFCSRHQNGFCHCGKVVSFYKRSKLLQKLKEENERNNFFN